LKTSTLGDQRAEFIWWHQVNVEAVEGKVPTGQFPRVTKKVGQSPPQYADEDE
jgi:hypothetical protein